MRHLSGGVADELVDATARARAESEKIDPFDIAETALYLVCPVRKRSCTRLWLIVWARTGRRLLKSASDLVASFRGSPCEQRTIAF